MRPTLNDIRNGHDAAWKERPVMSPGERAAMLLGRVRFLTAELGAEDWRLGFNPERVRADYKRQLEICLDDLRRIGFGPVAVAAE